MGVIRLGMPCSVPDELSLSTELIMFLGQSSCFKCKSFFRESKTEVIWLIMHYIPSHPFTKTTTTAKYKQTNNNLLQNTDMRLFLTSWKIHLLHFILTFKFILHSSGNSFGDFFAYFMNNFQTVQTDSSQRS